MTMLDMLEKQASQVKTAADQFRAISRELDKVAYKPFKSPPIAGVDKLFAVRDYESPIYRSHYDDPGAVEKLLSMPPLPRVADTTHNPSVEQKPPQPSKDGDDIRMMGKEIKDPGDDNVWTPDQKPQSEGSDGSIVSMTPPGGGEKTGARRSIVSTISKLAARGRLRTLDGWSRRE